MGSFTAFGDIGRVGISAFVTILVALINWRKTAFLYGILSFTVIVVVLLTNRGSMVFPDNKRKEHKQILGLSKTSSFITAIVTGFIDSLASSTIFVFIPFLFIYRGASTSIIGAMTGAFFIGNMIGKVGLGKISDKIGNKEVFIASEVLMALLLLLMSSIDNILALSFIAVALGAVTKGTVPIINTLIAQSIPDKSLMEKGFGISSIMTGIAGTVTPIVYGLFADKYTIVSVFYISAAMALCAPIPIVIRWISRRQNRDQSET